MGKRQFGRCHISLSTKKGEGIKPIFCTKDQPVSEPEKKCTCSAEEIYKIDDHPHGDIKHVSDCGLFSQPPEKKCCDKCWHINMAHPTSKNYCEDRECECHHKMVSQPPVIAFCNDCGEEFTEWLSESKECPECEGYMYFQGYLKTESPVSAWEIEFDKTWPEGLEQPQSYKDQTDKMKSFIARVLDQALLQSRLMCCTDLERTSSESYDRGRLAGLEEAIEELEWINRSVPERESKEFDAGLQDFYERIKGRLIRSLKTE